MIAEFPGESLYGHSREFPDDRTAVLGHTKASGSRKTVPAADRDQTLTAGRQIGSVHSLHNVDLVCPLPAGTDYFFRISHAASSTNEAKKTRTMISDFDMLISTHIRRTAALVCATGGLSAQ